MSNWIAIETFANHAAADMVRELLEQNGIDAVTSSDDAGGTNPELAYTIGVTLQVHAEDEAEARRLLAEYNAEETSDEE